MSNITDIFGREFTLNDLPVIPPIEQLHNAMICEDITPPQEILLDGAIHRFGSKLQNWYCGYSDGIMACTFGNWKEGTSFKWVQNIGRDLTPIERINNDARMRELKKAREEGLKLIREKAASEAETIWANAIEADNHPYLVKKNIKPHGSKIASDGRLIVPVIDVNGDIKSIQYINADSGKLFLKGGETGGHFWRLEGQEGTIYLAEGFATAASINEVTGCLTYIGYSASNLPKVAAILRAKYGNTSNIVIIGDNDKNGVGKKYAEQAASDIGARCVIPDIEGDANDYIAAGRDLLQLLQPKQTGYLQYLDDFIKNIKPISWIVKGLIPKNSFGMVHGSSGVGKSYIVLDCSMAIASNKPDWFGHKIRGGKVAYLAGEGVHGMGLRALLWKQENPEYSKADIWLSDGAVDLNTPEGLQKVTDSLIADQIEPTLIIVDTLHRFLHGDENSAQDAKTMIDACKVLQVKFNCSVILVHHTGVAAEAQNRARGSSAWKGALDFEIGVTPIDDYPELAEIKNLKQKDGKAANNIIIERMVKPINGMFDEDGDVVTNCIIVQADKPEEIRKESNKITEVKKRFERAWFASGADVHNDAPYISRSAMMDYLIGNECLSNENARKLLQSGNDRFIGLLQKESLIVENLHGWIVCEDLWLSGMMLQK